MALVAKGVSRQDAHEQIRVLSHQAGDVVKKQGKDNDLIERITNDPFFAPVVDQIKELQDPTKFVGRAPEQVQKFCGKGGEVETMLLPYREAASKIGTVKLNV